LLLLILAVIAVPRKIIRTTAHKAFSYVLLLLKVGNLSSLVVLLSLPFALGLVGLKILFLHHMGARTSLIAMSTQLLCSRLFFNIKSADRTGYNEFLSLVFHRSSKVPLGRRQFGNDTAGQNFF
jgi:hypothetical protein